MDLDLHPDIRLQKLSIGAEKAPLLVIDNVVNGADALVDHAAGSVFVAGAGFYPGIRVVAPPEYQRLILTRLRAALLDCLGVPGGELRLSMCHYSLVTTPADKLVALQQIPHVDSLSSRGLATIHYLFKSNLGGTAFYRHRKTRFEYVDEARNDAYIRSLRAEVREQALGPGYINGDTALFEQVAKLEGVFNRMLVYRRNSLHSGSIDAGFVPDANPRTGRLSINSFIDLV
jgi:Family of unknown function (DUF6445)